MDVWKLMRCSLAYQEGLALAARGVVRFVQLHMDAARHREVGHEPEPLVFNLLRELDALRPQCGNRARDVLAEERNVVPARYAMRRRFRVNAHVRGRQVENEPAIADIRGREFEDIAVELGLKASSVRSLLRTGLNTIRNRVAYLASEV